MMSLNNNSSTKINAFLNSPKKKVYLIKKKEKKK